MDFLRWAIVFKKCFLFIFYVSLSFSFSLLEMRNWFNNSACANLKGGWAIIETLPTASFYPMTNIFQTPNSRNKGISIKFKLPFPFVASKLGQSFNSLALFVSFLRWRWKLPRKLALSSLSGSASPWWHCLLPWWFSVDLGERNIIPTNLVEISGCNMTIDKKDNNSWETKWHFTYYRH